MPETITIDGRGNTVRDAVREMRARMRPLEQRGFHPISEVEVVDEKKKEIIETFGLTDPEFQVHLKADTQGEDAATGKKVDTSKAHMPERKERFQYVARIRLEA